MELPRVLHSPWRWILFACGMSFVLVGLSVFAGETDLAELVIMLSVGAFGGLMVFFAWRSGVVVSRSHVEERGLFVKPERIAWADVSEVRIVPGLSSLPSKTIELVGKNGVDDVTLSSLSWYAFRAHRVPRRVAEFQRLAAALMDES